MGEWDFFVSYTASDRAWAEWVAWELEDAGYRVLVQAWDMVPGGNWVNGMHEGVSRARRTVALVSAAYAGSVYGAAEWQAAWRDDPSGADRKLVVLRVEDCARPGLLGSVVSEDLFGLSEVAARERLLGAVRGAVGGRSKPVRAPGFPGRARQRFPGSLPEIWKVPPRNPNFTGRVGSLARLREAMRAPGTVTVHSLRGMGGVGKSQLAVEYAHRYAGEFDVVWWVPAEQPAAIPDHLAGLGDRLGVPGPVEAVLEALRDRRWLLVFDNAEDVGAVRPFLPAGGGRVLVTTRRSGFGALGAVLDVDVLDRAESVALVKRRVPGAGDEEADELAAELGDLPLAVEQASAYVETTGRPGPEYLALLRGHPARMIARGELGALWDLSLAALARQDPAAVRLLHLLAWLAPEPVPLDLFTRHPGILPPPLAEVAADPIAFGDTVGALVDWSFVRRDPGEVTVVHRLLLRALRARHVTTPPPEVQLLLRADLPEEIEEAPGNWPRWRALLPHVLAVHDDVEADPARTTGDTYWLLDRAARYLYAHGRSAQALPLRERVVALVEGSVGPESSRFAAVLNNLGITLLDLGRAEEARPLLARALRITEAVDGPDHPDVAIRLSNMATLLQDSARPEEALPLLERALSITEARLGPAHPRLATCLNNLGSVLRSLHRAEEAVPLLERALAVDEASYGDDHPKLVPGLCNLGLAELELDRPAEALRHLGRALVIARAVYEPDHPYLTVCRDAVDAVRGHLARRDRARSGGGDRGWGPIT